MVALVDYCIGSGKVGIVVYFAGLDCTLVRGWLATGRREVVRQDCWSSRLRALVSS
jgi:hypothetical protein